MFIVTHFQLDLIGMLSIKTTRVKSFSIHLVLFSSEFYLNIQITLVLQALKDRKTKNILHTFSGTSFFICSSIKLQFIVEKIYGDEPANEKFENPKFLFVMSNIFKRFSYSSWRTFSRTVWIEKVGFSTETNVKVWSFMATLSGKFSAWDELYEKNSMKYQTDLIKRESEEVLSDLKRLSYFLIKDFFLKVFFFNINYFLLNFL